MRRPAAAPPAPKAKAKARTRRQQAGGIDDDVFDTMFASAVLLNCPTNVQYMVVNLSTELVSPIKLLCCEASSMDAVLVGHFVVEDEQTMSFFKAFDPEADNLQMLHIIATGGADTKDNESCGVILAICNTLFYMKKPQLQERLARVTLEQQDQGNSQD